MSKLVILLKISEMAEGPPVENWKSTFSIAGMLSARACFILKKKTMKWNSVAKYVIFFILVNYELYIIKKRGSSTKMQLRRGEREGLAAALFWEWQTGNMITVTAYDIRLLTQIW